MRLTWSRFDLDFSRKTHVMGILNVTPDSFSDGGLHFDASSAVNQGRKMVSDGADMIDIGGESTRPGAEPVSLDEELRRTIPVIKALAKEVDVPISIDTYKAEVARQALDAGASLVNDISGLRFDAEMPGVVARYKVPVVIMHIKGRPREMQQNPTYDAVVTEIIDYFRISIRLAKTFGIPDEYMILDPGIGFGKTFDHNLEILNNLQQFTLFDKPILVGPSRKAFLGKILGDVPASDRLEGTAAAVAVSILKGASIIRVHDVKEMARVAKVVDAIRREKVA